MAEPMTATQLVDQLKRWGVRYVEIPGWATHKRDPQHGAWGPVNGFIWHHTGATITAANAKAYAAGVLYQGRPDLPGPLCQLSVGLDGTVYLVGWGRANHAGGGDPAVLQHVINEDYTSQLHPTRGNANGVDGNAHFYGVEIQYSGGHEMAPAQYEAALRLSAAILEHHSWSEKSVIGHGEWSSDKWDPGHAPGQIMPMPAVRADVRATLSAGPKAATSGPAAGSSSTTSKDDSAMPKYVNLGLTKPYELKPGVWDSIEYTSEWTDETGDHATGGSVFVRGPARFTGSLSLRISGLAPGETVQARMSEYADDKLVQDHPIHEVIGTDGDAFAVIPLVKRVGADRGMRVRLLNNGVQPVTVTSATLTALVWKENS